MENSPWVVLAAPFCTIKAPDCDCAENVAGLSGITMLCWGAAGAGYNCIRRAAGRTMTRCFLCLVRHWRSFVGVLLFTGRSNLLTRRVLGFLFACSAAGLHID